MTSSDLDLQLRRFRARREGPPKPLAGALLDAGRAAEALEVIHLSLLDGEPDPELLILEGRALYDQGDLREAQAALLRALKVNPQLKEGYRWLGQVLIERGDPTRAVQVFDRAVKLDPRDSGLAQQRNVDILFIRSPPPLHMFSTELVPQCQLCAAYNTSRSSATA